MARSCRPSFSCGRSALLNITIVGTVDRQLEELLRGQTTRIRSVPVADLLALAQPSAGQPDVVILRARTPPPLATLKRQHHHGCGDRGRPAGAGVDARGMGPASTSGSRSRSTSSSSMPPSSASPRCRPATSTARCLPSSGPRAAGHDDDCRERGHCAGAGGRGRRTLLMDFHLSYGDAAVFLGAEPRFSVADAMETAPSRRVVLPEPHSREVDVVSACRPPLKVPRAPWISAGFQRSSTSR